MEERRVGAMNKIWRRFTLHIPALKAGNPQMAKMKPLTYAVIFSSDLSRPVTAAGRSSKTSVDANIDRA
jgi:hypothetical protein